MSKGNTNPCPVGLAIYKIHGENPKSEDFDYFCIFVHPFSDTTRIPIESLHSTPPNTAHC